MANVVNCPQCHKALKLSDTSAGKRVRCSACKHPILVPAKAADLEESEEDVEEEEQRPVNSSRRASDEEENEAPRRPRVSREEDEEEDRPRRPRRRRAAVDAGGVPILPFVYAILACLFSCAPLVGLGLAYVAMTRADAALDELPGGKRYESARTSLKVAKIIAFVAMGLSAVMFVVAVILVIVSPKK